MAFAKRCVTMSGEIKEGARRGRIFPDLVRPGLLIRKVYDWSVEATTARLMGRGLPETDDVSALVGLGMELDALNRSTEGQFLSIGESLQSFHERSGEISAMASSVAKLSSGDEITGAIEELRCGPGRMHRTKIKLIALNAIVKASHMFFHQVTTDTLHDDALLAMWPFQPPTMKNSPLFSSAKLSQPAAGR